MSDLAEADRYLLEQIQRGESDGWTQLVARYQGRLTAFARKQLNATDAEDVVQDAFLSFLTSLHRFRQDASLETFLFTILRRRIIDRFRSSGRASVCSLQEELSLSSDDRGASVESIIPSAEPSASWYARRDEERDVQETALGDALRKLTRRMKESLNFRDLKVAEMIFYAQLRNKDIAARMQMTEQQIALMKHRFIQRISAALPDDARKTSTDKSGFEILLTKTWESCRPSCPKRSVVGRFVLGTLDEEWQEFLAFHIQILGCRMCQANLDDLSDQTQKSSTDSIQRRIIDSTIGFLSRASKS